MWGPTSMKDVAEAAGVARSTVHNTIHRPHCVAPETRRRVYQAMAALESEHSGEEAKHHTGDRKAPDAVRAAARSTTRSREPRRRIGLALSTVDTHASPSEENGWWLTLKAGDRVQISHDGSATCNGSVDTLMPDGSVVWIWQDNGLGRTMVVPGERFGLRRLPGVNGERMKEPEGA